jgi:hypothetical protein
MADYSETPQEVERKTVRETNAGRERIIRSDYDRVVREPHGVSGGAVAAIVIAAIACAVLITLLIMNNQQQQRDADRERTEEQAQSSQQQQPPQPAQQPPIVVVPGAQPAPASPPASAPAQPSTADKGIPSSAALEASVTSKLLEDSMLGTYPVDVKAENGVVTLSGDLPTQALKQRATTVAKSVTGVSGVINNIRVKSQ